MNQDIVGFYQRLRVNDRLLAILSKGDTVEGIMEIAVEEAGKLGFHFTKEEALAIGMDIDTLRANVMIDDELNDFELELIAAGVTDQKAQGG
ncbi:hypothetical protein [Oceanibaculum nanhaiense]|uniref:hypothetical protein n=1 Tax=Oceanibaculum nanhaiense TaxID=1909734 RepID=UPI00396D1F9D